MSNGFPAELKRRLEEKCREERAQARLLIGLGIPLALGTLLVLTTLLSFVLWAVGVKFLPAYFLSLVVVASALMFDTWKHPSEHWTVANYYLAGAIDPAGNPRGSRPIAVHGVFAGMPLMASVGDPANLAAQGEKIASGCANVLLGGPRNIRRGFEQLRAVRAKSDERVESAGVRFLAWLKEKGPVTEEEVEEVVKSDPLLRKGFALASELGFLSRRKEGPQRLLEMKE